MPRRLTHLGPAFMLTLLLSGCGDPAPLGTYVEILPKLTVTTLTPTVNEGEEAKFVIQLSEPVASPVGVRYYTQAGTASPNGDPPDYDGQDTPFNPTEAVFNPGQTELEVTINTTQDTVDEDDETFRFYLHSGAGADVDTRLQYYAEVTIIDDDDPWTLELAPTVPDSVTIGENAGKQLISFVLYDKPDNDYNTPGRDITLPLQYGGSAVRGEDFRAPDEVLLKKGVSLTEVHVEIELIDDITPNEPDKDIVVTLGTPDHALLGPKTQTTITLLDDDGTGALNDTGVTQCQDDTTQGDCPMATHPGQDGDRDTPMRFSFYSNGSETCVVDETTGLMWEVKQDNSDLGSKRRAISTYTWYETADNINGGDPGTNTASGTQAGACGLDNCTTSAYIAELNRTGLCGFNDWRLPKAHELLSLVRYDLPGCVQYDYSGTTCLKPAAIDTAIFPRTTAYRYWSATPSAYDSNYAWAVDFADGRMGTFRKAEEFHLRAVRRVRPGDLTP